MNKPNMYVIVHYKDGSFKQLGPFYIVIAHLVNNTIWMLPNVSKHYIV